MLKALGFEEQTFTVLYHQINKLNLSTLAITSAEVGEGKTTLASILAQYAAKDNKRVLLIDFNSLNPTLTEQCEARDEKSQNWRELKIFPSGIPKVDILIAPRESGVIFQLTNEVILKELLHEHAKNYDQLILDCPAVNAENGSYIPATQICSVAEGVLLIVLSRSTIFPQVEQTLMRLAREKVNLVGAIMNDKIYSNLLSELTRETHRLDKYLPNFTAKLRSFLKKQTILNIEI